MREYNEKNAALYDYYRSGHILNRKFKQISDSIVLISQNKKIQKIAEIGSGTGRISHLLANKFPEYEIKSYEKNTEFIKYAKKKYQANNLSFDALDIDNNITNEKFDIIITLEVLHHVNRLNNAIKNINHSLEPNGSWIVIEPNLYNPYIFFFQFIASNEKNFSQKIFEKLTKNFFSVNNKKYICLIPSYIKKPNNFLVKSENKIENFFISGGSVTYILDKLNNNLYDINKGR